MTDEKLVNLMNEARMISASQNVLYPMLEDMIQKRLDLACSEFRGGKVDMLPHIAYITSLKDLLGLLKRTQVAGNRASIELIDKN